jgi:alpha-L-fucosidase
LGGGVGVLAGLRSSLGPFALARGVSSPSGVEAAKARPDADQMRWQDLEVGMFVHFSNETYLNGRPPAFSVPASEVNPVDLDTDQWARTAVALGARYIVFVAKHQYGFCCWQTETTEFSLRSSPWKNGKGDILAMLRASCDRFGLGLGVYLSPRDDHFGAATGGICKTEADQAKYNEIYRAQLTELLSRYGPMVEVWFDGATATPVGDLLKRYQPHAAVFQGPEATIRWVGNENGFAPYPCWNGVDRAESAAGTATALDSNPLGDRWLPSEVDVSIRRPDWFWTKDNAGKVLSVDQLLSIYYRSVGRGAQLLLNIPPDTTGLLPQPDVAAVTAFGKEVKRRFGEPIASTSGEGEGVVLALPRGMRIDTVVLQEAIGEGERVRGYRLEGRVEGRWKVLGEGSAIGHKRIQPVTPEVVDAVRLAVSNAAGRPAIRRLAVYDTGVAPPPDWNAASALWSRHLVGTWKDYRFEFDLRRYVKEAAQYRLRLVAAGGTITELRDVTLILDGVPQPKLLKRVPGHPEELILDVTGLGDTGTISGRVVGSSSGQALLGKL